MNAGYESVSSELAALKNLMAQTDHVPNKLIEGLLSALEGATALTLAPCLVAYGKAALEQCGDALKNRAAWRARIGVLEEELARLEEEGGEDA